MSNALRIGAAATTPLPGANSKSNPTGSAGSADSTAALQSQISQYQVQLNDWVTCVSASTPKGKAEIQSISGKISAIKEQIARIQSKPKSTATTTTGTDAASAQSKAAQSTDSSKSAQVLGANTARGANSIDIWV